MKRKMLNLIHIMGISIVAILLLYNLFVVSSYLSYAASDEYINHASFSLSSWYDYINKANLAKMDVLVKGNPCFEESIPLLKVYIDKDKLARLSSDLPKSGKDYKRAELILDNKSYVIKIKLKGDSSYHWAFPKKSYKIKIINETIYNHGIIDLTNPKFYSLMNEYISNRFGKDIGLLVAEEQYVNLCINDNYEGVYLYDEPIDKVFLELKKNTEGDIYVGENLFEDEILGTHKSLFMDERNWQIKHALFENDQPQTNLERFLKIISAVNHEKRNIDVLLDMIDEEEYHRYYAWSTLIETYHFDFYHNQVLYYDYTDGRFQTIPKDNAGLVNKYEHYMTQINDELDLAIHRDPTFVNNIMILIADQAKKDTVDDLKKFAIETKDSIGPSMYQDRFKGPIFKRIPMSNEEFEKNFAELTKRIEEIKKFSSYLNETNVSYKINGNVLSIYSCGWAGIELTSINGIQLEKNNRIFVPDMDLDGKHKAQEFSKEYLSLYPGRKLILKTILNPGPDPYYIDAHLQPACLRYDFFILANIDLNLSIKGINPFTGDTVNIKEDISRDESDYSIHPWQIELERKEKILKAQMKIIEEYPKFNQSKNKIIVPAGKYAVDKNIIVPKNTILEMKPGVELVMHPNVSIVSFGKVIAEGTMEKQIKIIAKDVKNPWGVFGLANEGAENSSFKYATFSDGNEMLIEGIYFSGMFNAYHAENILVDHCTFRNAHADDALNFKYSNSTVKDSYFVNNSADAIDFDFMTGEISHSLFENNGNDAIDVSGSTTIIKDNYVLSSGDKCISIGEKSSPRVINNLLTNCKTGVESKDLSTPLIKNTVLANNKIGANAYQKKDFFGPSFPIFENCLFVDNEKDTSNINVFEGIKFETDYSEIHMRYSHVKHAGEGNFFNQGFHTKDLQEAGWKYGGAGLSDQNTVRTR